jgi:hypothetical protein
MLGVVIVVIFEANGSLLGTCGKGHNAGQIAPAAKEVQLDASQHCEKGERINQSEGSRDSCAQQQFFFVSLSGLSPSIKSDKVLTADL